jgi:hypothetical protein
MPATANALNSNAKTPMPFQTQTTTRNITTIKSRYAAESRSGAISSRKRVRPVLDPAQKQFWPQV